ncbi:S-layer homology domain-containing protein [Paenibacillus methanolicus]|uniref:S-layer family protein n=1 Tax=Paenibacillus methanolicus TaxID=582686 RepID=A0A5S5CGP3_9BACL|nr:S-layer homology domain-containing protein [Paenibacillus methanolicus]TYP77510.1 S-layer family protein [Paenibacillus methanolicus]
MKRTGLVRTVAFIIIACLLLSGLPPIAIAESGNVAGTTVGGQSAEAETVTQYIGELVDAEADTAEEGEAQPNPQPEVADESATDDEEKEKEPQRPAQVESFEWTLQSYDIILLSWTYPGQNDVTFRIARNGVTIADNVEAHFYTDRGLDEARSYRYEIWAVNEQGESEAPAQLTAGTSNAYQMPISVAYDGAVAEAEMPVVSEDGTSVAFVSTDPDILEGAPPSPYPILYVRDIRTGVTERISQSAPFLDIPQHAPVFSRDGSKLVFQDGSNGSARIFLYDRKLDRNEWLEMPMSQSAYEPSLSGDGNIIAYTGRTAAPGGSGEYTDVYVYNKSARHTTRLDIPGREQAAGVLNVHPAVSGDGRYVAFVNGSKGMGTLTPHLFLYDRTIGAIEEIDFSRLGVPDRVEDAAINRDGSIIAYIGSGLDSPTSVNIYNRTEDRVETIYEVNSGVGPDMAFSDPSVSADGRYVAFHYENSSPDDPASGPFTERSGVVRYDRETGAFKRIGHSGEASDDPSISGDGSKIAYRTAQGVYLACFAGPCYETPDPGQLIGSARRVPNQTIHGQAVYGTGVNLLATGRPGQSLEGAIAYRVLTEGGAVADQSAVVPLTETAGSGVYTGSFAFPEGTVAVQSYAARLADDPSVSVASAQPPLKVSGQLHVRLTSTEPGFWAGGRLILASESRHQGHQAELTGEDEYALPLGDAADYKLTVIGNNGARLYEQSGIAVKNGERVELNLELTEAASLTAKLMSEQGEVITGIPIQIRSNTGAMLQSGVTDDNGELSLQGRFEAGEEIIVVPIAPKPYRTVASRRITLAAGPNDVAFTLPMYRKGTVAGIVTGRSGPLSGASVTLHHAEYPPLRTVTDEEGRYSLEAYEGHYELAVTAAGAASSGGFGQTTNVSIAAAATIQKDIAVTSLGKAKISIELLQTRLDGVSNKIALHDGFDAARYGMTVEAVETGGWQSLHQISYLQSAAIFQGMPGESYRICAKGADNTAGSACQTVELDDFRYGEATLRLEEAARITGRFLAESGAQYAENTLRRIDPEDESRQTVVRHFDTDASHRFTLSLAEPGTYEIVSRNWTPSFRVARQRIVVSRGEVAALGDIPYATNDKKFEGKPDNFLTAQPQQVLPGDKVAMRASYRLAGGSVTEASWLISVPEGFAFVEGSSTVNGTPAAAAKVSEARYELPIGSIGAGQSGVLTYWLQAKEGLTEDAEAQVAIAFRSGTAMTEETIGRAVLTAVGVTLEPAQEYVSVPQVTLSGRAPANLIVRIYKDGILHGQTEASPGGIWLYEAKWEEPAVVELGRDSTPTYAWTAEVSTPQRLLASGKALVTYDKHRPSLSELALSTGASRQPVKIKPADGVSRFPINYRRYLDMKMTFAHTERVENVRVEIGSKLVIPAEFDPQTSTFIAHTSAPESLMGEGIYVKYDVIPEPFQPGPTPTAEQWEELFAQAPEAWRNAAYRVGGGMSGPDASGFVATPPIHAEFDIGGKQSDVTMKWKAKAVRGALAEHEPYRLEYHVIPSSNELQVVMTARAELYGDLGKQIVGLSAMKDDGGVIKDNVDHIVNVVSFVFDDSKFMEIGGTLWDLKDYVMDGLDFGGYADKLLAFQDYVNENECLGRLKEPYLQMIDDQYEHAKNMLVVKYFTTGIGLVAGTLTLAVPPVGILALSTAATVLGDAAKNDWDEGLDYMKQEFDKHMEWRRAMEDAGVLESCTYKPKKKDKVGEPIWIFDPSGYVYEGMPSNRVQGVTATLLYKDPATGEWGPWNADWYGQANPQVTDKEGKYGWDVPEGWWQVVYEKKGYELARSEELKVLPPHFDVNIPITTLQPSEVSGVRSIGAGEALELLFTKPMLVASVTEELLTVEGADHEPVRGTLTAIGAEHDMQGRALAKTFRFTPQTPLQVGAAYELTIEGSVLSYAGVPMSADYAESIVIPPADAKPQDAIRNVQIYPGNRSLDVTWEELDSLELAKLRVEWRKQGETAPAGSIEVAAGVGTVHLGSLEAGTAYEVKVATVNVNGVASPGVPAQGSTRAAVADADLQPPAEVGTPAVHAEAEALTVTWTDPEDDDYRSALISWREAGNGAFSSPVYLDKGVQEYRLGGLKAKTRYELKIATMDQHYNESAGVTVADSTGSGTTGGNNGNNGNTGNNGGTSDGDTGSGKGESVKVSSKGADWMGFGGDVRLTVPEGAFDEATVLRISRHDEAGSLQPKYRSFSPVVTLAAEPAASAGSARFRKRVRLSIRVVMPPKELIDTLKLGIYRRDEATGRWVYAGGAWHAKQGAVEADIDQLGQYAVLSYANPFRDTAGHWAQQEIDVLASRHIVSGISESRFEPNRPITRAELVTLLLRVANPGAAATIDAVQGSGFKDVAEESWYAPYIGTAVKLGIATGSNGSFRPDDPVTRQEMAVMLGRALQLKADGMAQEADFADNERIAAWASAYVLAAKQLRLIQGVSGNRFDPHGLATRAQAAAILYRALNHLGMLHQD